MSDYNFQRGGVVTLLIEAEGDTRRISATRIRETLRTDAPEYDDLCDGCKEIVKQLMKNKTDEEI